jgi:hypothetical protein
MTPNSVVLVFHIQLTSTLVTVPATYLTSSLTFNDTCVKWIKTYFSKFSFEQTGQSVMMGGLVKTERVITLVVMPSRFRKRRITV